jgi:hypothetical protein
VPLTSKGHVSLATHIRACRNMWLAKSGCNRGKTCTGWRCGLAQQHCATQRPQPLHAARVPHGRADRNDVQLALGLHDDESLGEPAAPPNQICRCTRSLSCAYVRQAGLRLRRKRAVLERKVVGSLESIDRTTIVMRSETRQTVHVSRMPETRLDTSTHRGTCSRHRAGCVAPALFGGAGLTALVAWIDVQSQGVGITAGECG